MINVHVIVAGPRLLNISQHNLAYQNLSEKKTALVNVPGKVCSDFDRAHSECSVHHAAVRN